MTNYETWREGEMKKDPIKQLKAEANWERQKQESFVEVEEKGQKKMVKKSIAERLYSKKTATPARKVFTIPAIKGFTE